MSIVWPTANNFPQAPRIGYRFLPRDPNTRTNMGAGEPKVRRLTTRIIYDYSFQLLLNEDQVNELVENFYLVDTNAGSQKFEWVHPRTGATMEFRFMSAPDPVSVSTNLYSVQVDLEGFG
ncbi:MAG: hypothetical protein K2Y22_04200 [Candidatus Obscuribacterales bacterium]|nr:hypothetical protein [Candidatus Obscuribacterales bacterium]